MAIGALLLCVGFGILPLGVSYFYVIITVVIWTFGEILIFPTLAASVSNQASDENLGKYMGMYSFAFSLAFAVAPAIGGFVYGHYSPRILWFGIGFCGIMVSAGFLLTEKILNENVLDIASE